MRPLSWLLSLEAEEALRFCALLIDEKDLRSCGDELVEPGVDCYAAC